MPICSKIFEKLIFDSIDDFIDKNNHFNNNQSGFRPRESCIHQLIAFTRNIFSAFDANLSLEVRDVFLDLSKVFDRVWHDGLLYKLKSNGIGGNLFRLIKSFLNNRCQRVVLNGQSLVWKSLAAGVPQVSVIRSLFFLIYINDLPLGFTTNVKGLTINVKLCVDDTSLLSLVNSASVSASRLNNDLVKIQDWAFNGNCRLTQILLNKRKSLFFNNSLIEQDTTDKHLCLKLDHKLTFQYHVNEKIKAMKRIGLL